MTGMRGRKAAGQAEVCRTGGDSTRIYISKLIEVRREDHEVQNPHRKLVSCMGLTEPHK